MVKNFLAHLPNPKIGPAFIQQFSVIILLLNLTADACAGRVWCKRYGIPLFENFNVILPLKFDLSEEIPSDANK